MVEIQKNVRAGYCLTHVVEILFSAPRAYTLCLWAPHNATPLCGGKGAQGTMWDVTVPEGH